MPEVENGERLLQVLISRDQLAEIKKGGAARVVAGQKHRRVFRLLGCGQKLVREFQSEEGIAGMRRGISAVRASGGTPYTGVLCLLASGLGRIGRPEEGLQVLEEGRASVAKTEEQIDSPSLHHVKGELLLAQNPSDVANAELCFHTAIKIARRQSARSGELRATMSLARLLSNQGNRDEARTMLAEIYGWFTEGLDTADLKDAKALLDKLNE